MNIVVLQDYLRSGGTERQSVLLAETFASKEHSCTLLTFRPGGSLSRTVCRATYHSLQPIDTKLDWFAPGLLRCLRSIKPDVVLCMGRMANCYAGRIKRLMPSLIVVATMRTGKALPKLYQQSLLSVDHVVANSQEARKSLLRQYRVPDENISVINNALIFSHSTHTAGPEDSVFSRYASGKTLILLCVAMFRPEKNQRELIEIVAGLPPEFNYQLWLAGDGPCLSECQDLAAERGLRERVRFLGWLPDPSELYEQADIAVHASCSEALSNFLIEAQYHGLPAVAYDAQGNDECMIPGRTGLIIPPGDRNEFRKAIELLSSEPPEQRELRAARARAFARERFDRSRQPVAYLNLFRNLGAR